MAPYEDIEARKPIWDSLQMIFMDTDPGLFLGDMAKTCAASKYSIEELKEILFREVFPACRSNLFMIPVPEWAGFEIGSLSQRILKKHRHGKRMPFVLRRYTAQWWRKLEPEIRLLRGHAPTNS